MAPLKNLHLGLALLVLGVLIYSCVPSPEELASTSVADTDAAANSTLTKTTVWPTTVTPSPTLLPTQTPSPTPTIRSTEPVINVEDSKKLIIQIGFFKNLSNKIILT